MDNFTELPETISHNDKIELKSGTKPTLPLLFRTNFDKIKNDITQLYDRGILTSPRLGYFEICRFKDNPIYMYHHTSYMAFSKVKFGMIARCAKSISERTVSLPKCQHENHDYLLPYYNGNAKLKLCYNEIIAEHVESDRASAARMDLSELNEYIDTNSCELSRFFSGGATNMVANDYDEDTWTTRLFYGLRKGIDDFDGNLYAHYRGKHAALGGKLPSGISSNGFLFKGSPDFIFKSIPINVSHSLGDDYEAEWSSDTSGESVRVEHAYQPSPNTSYKSGSIIPIKAGQLVAAILFSIQAKLLRRLCKGKQIVLPLKGHGLYIHKVTGAIHIEVQINQNGTYIIATSLGGDGALSKKSMCCAINHLLSICKKPRETTNL